MQQNAPLKRPSEKKIADPTPTAFSLSRVDMYAKVRYMIKLRKYSLEHYF